ncbi:MAG: VCBS repeat-containing protein [Desulfatibacillum sp.]|nr:VCBS repeat-containing protein [Desulfatibacillum sp.]
MDREKMVNTNDPQEVAKALARVGSTVLLANPKMGCAMALTNTGNGLEKRAHWFSTSHPITTKGALSGPACKELTASGILPSMANGSGSPTKRLVARGAMAAAFSGAMLLGMGTTDAMARDFGFTYYGGTNPLADVLAPGAKPAFVDIDNDGDLDCFVGSENGDIVYLKNGGNSSSPSFSVVAGDANPLSGTDYFRHTSPAFVDIDGDGDMDCFVGTFEGDYYQTWEAKGSSDYSSISFFENTGTPQVPVFNVNNVVLSDTRKTMVYNPLVVGDIWNASPVFVDIDGDGDMDAFVGDFYGVIHSFENMTINPDSTKGAITGTVAFEDRGVLQDYDGNYIWAYNGYASPAFSDVDGDGDMDLFVGNKYGAVQYFENTGTSTDFKFTERTMCQNPARLNPGMYSAPAFADINGDGLADLFFGASPFEWSDKKGEEPTFLTDFNSNLSIRYYQNTGTATEPAFRSRGDNPFNLGPAFMMPSPALGDIDGDGDLDAIVGAFVYIDRDKAKTKDKQESQESQESLKYYENIGSESNPNFALWSMESNPWNVPRKNLSNGWYMPSPAIADLDGDGSNEVYVGYSVDQEVLNSSKGPLTYTRYIEAYNYITNTRSFEAADQNPLGDLDDLPLFPGPAFVDIDGDGDLDVFISGLFEEVEYATLLRRGGVVTITNEADIAFYRNEGTPITPTFTLVTGEDNPLTGVVGVMLPRLNFADVDGDGDQDAVLGDLYPLGYFFGGEDSTGRARYFENTGTKAEPVFVEREGNANPFEVMTKKTIPGATVLADLDNDKDVDAITGDYFGKLTYFRNIKTVEEANAILKDDDDWLCFVDSAESQASLWDKLTESCKQGAQKIREFFSPS